MDLSWGLAWRKRFHSSDMTPASKLSSHVNHQQRIWLGICLSFSAVRLNQDLDPEIVRISTLSGNICEMAETVDRDASHHKKIPYTRSPTTRFPLIKRKH